MNTNSLKLLALATGVTLIAQSCSGPTYVQSSPPPPEYTQAPPPPPQDYSQTPPPVAPQQEEAPAVTYQSFYNELSPYGQWVYTVNYGNVWVPSAGADFQPYGSSGHWVLTNYGWTWVSDYSWGWAPFHYGRWEFDGLMGWYWIPGYEWSPAWVNWRSCDGYYGWAPLGPTYVNGGYDTYTCPPERYVFVSVTYINSPNVYNYYQPRNQNSTYYSRSTVVNNTYYDRESNSTYYAGPRKEEVEKHLGAPVRPVTVVSSNTPERGGVSGSEVRMFRPKVVQPGSEPNMKPAPEKVFQKNEVAPISQRAVLTTPNQPRVAPFKPEPIQKTSNGQNQQQPPVKQEQPKQPEQQKPPVQEQQRPPMQQQQPEQQKPPVQEQQRPPMQQQPKQQQTQQPAPQQQPRQAQKPPVQPRQQQPKQQKPPKQKPQKQPQNQAVPQKDNKQ